MRLRNIVILLLSLSSLSVSASESSVATVAADTAHYPWISAFREHTLPDSFALLPKYKTGFDINYSKDRYVGVWALTAPVARHYGLRIDDVIDQRLDPVLSAVTAARYLQDITTIYGSADIAAMAYLNGPSYVVDAARSQNIELDSADTSDINKLWTLMPYTVHTDAEPSQKADSVIGIYGRSSLPVTTLVSPMRAQTICDSLGIDTLLFRYYNPSVKDIHKWISGTKIWLPLQKSDSVIDAQIARLIDREQEAYNEYEATRIETIRSAEADRAKAIKKANAIQIYRVKSGDTLSHIAKKYHVSVRQIKNWNNLKSDFLRVGQRLKIKKL